VNRADAAPAMSDRLARELADPKPVRSPDGSVVDQSRLDMPYAVVTLTQGDHSSSGPGGGPLSAPKDVLVPYRVLLEAAALDLPTWT
jgi:hypothetical protein